MIPMTSENQNDKKENNLSMEQKKYFFSRLNVIEGQVRGIKQMIEENRKCDDILVQLSAVNNSLKSVGIKLIRNHLDTYVIHDMKEDKKEVIDEVIDLFSRIDS